MSVAKDDNAYWIKGIGRVEVHEILQEDKGIVLAITIVEKQKTVCNYFASKEAAEPALGLVRAFLKELTT